MVRKLGPTWHDLTRVGPLTALIDSVELGRLVSRMVIHVLAHVLAHVLLCTFLTVHFIFALGKFTSCPKDPHYVLGHYLVYMTILIGHVLSYLGLTHGCLALIL